MVLTEVALTNVCIVIFFLFVLSNLCATPTPAIMVRHDRVQYREKERKSEYNIVSLASFASSHLRCKRCYIIPQASFGFTG